MGAAWVLALTLGCDPVAPPPPGPPPSPEAESAEKATLREAPAVPRDPAERESLRAALDKSIRDLLEKPDANGNVVPDFSHVGYRGGGVPIPDVPAVVELSPQPEGDDRERIQAALDQIGAMPLDEEGFRGALLLKAGEYRVDGTLYLQHDGVVLRGEGQSPHGTVIIATRPAPRSEGLALIEITNKDWEREVEASGSRVSVASRLQFLDKGYESRMVEQHAGIGAKSLEVEDASGFKVGDEIVIEPYATDAWLETLGLKDRWGRETTYFTRYERTITGIDGNRITFDAPLLWHLEPEIGRAHV